MVKYFLGQSVLWSSWDRVKRVLTEDIVHREVNPDQKLLSRRLLTKTIRMPRWAARLFPASVAHSGYILEDSTERCVYCVNSANSGWTEIRQEAWVSSSLFGVSRAVQKFGEAPSKTLVETAKEAKEKAKETALAAIEKAKDLASKATTKQQQQQYFV
ncbi:unnamed protein product [Nyctereutes procyonoides]|uniref:(raccoon dog) hypothetical protein n=1 Tax=Nyctereutes procyonoides TaxID=34880 RepID=A0A811YX18_NYCPR|nr:unnamed protein product [Nyctereutes procyonoides]